MRVHKTETEQTPAPDFSVMEDEIRQDESKLEERKQALEQQRKQVENTERQEKLETRAQLLQDAQNWREMARDLVSEPETALFYYERAKAAEAEALRLGQELDLNEPTPAPMQVKPKTLTWMARNHRLVASFQVVAVLMLISVSLGAFLWMKHHIDKLNKLLPESEKMGAYDLTSIQKFFFEKLVVLTDLPTGLAMLFLIAPWVGFYVLPFLPSRKDFYTEFYDELSPFQRICISTAFVLGLLLCLALSHSVKP